MEPVKIIFFDIDGTLIDINTHEIPQSTKEALWQLKKQGVLLCIATGRPYMSLPVFEPGLFDGLLTFNGSVFHQNDAVVFHQSIPKSDVNKIIENGKRINRPVSLASLSRIGSNGVDPDLADFFALSNHPVDVIDDFDALAKEDIYQIMCGLVPSEYEAMLAGVSGAEITSWWPRAVDIIPKGSHKGVGILKVLAYYNLPVTASMAFGDGFNDVEMLQTVQHGVAMGNASAEVKAHADFVCDAIDEDGIYRFLTQHSLI